MPLPTTTGNKSIAFRAPTLVHTALAELCDHMCLEPGPLLSSLILREARKLRGTASLTHADVEVGGGVSASPLEFAPPIFPGRVEHPRAKVEDMEPPPAVESVKREEPVEDPLTVLRIRCAHARIKHNWDGVLAHLDELFDGEGVDATLASTVLGLLREKGMPNVPSWLEEFAASDSSANE